MNTFAKAGLSRIFLFHFQNNLSANAKFYCREMSGKLSCLEVLTMRCLFFWYVLLRNWANVDGRILHGHFNTADGITTPINQQRVATSHQHDELTCTAARVYKLISLILSYLPATSYCPSYCSV
jgi:hypothetical protein